MPDPRATEHTKQKFNAEAGSYDRMMAFMDRVMLRKLRVLLWSKITPGKLLEVGVGTGVNLPLYPENVDVTAIDIADRMLAEAKKKAELQGIAVDLQEANVEALPFPPETFDEAVATCVFCSVPDPIRGLQELRRVVKPGGKILLLEHVRLGGILGKIMDLLNPLSVRLVGTNINRQTVENVKRAGLKIEKVGSYHGGLIKLIEAAVPDEGDREVRS